MVTAEIDVAERAETLAEEAAEYGIQVILLMEVGPAGSHPVYQLTGERTAVEEFLELNGYEPELHVVEVPTARRFRLELDDIVEQAAVMAAIEGGRTVELEIIRHGGTVQFGEDPERRFANGRELAKLMAAEQAR